MTKAKTRQVEDLAFSPVQFPDRPTRPGRVVLIGANIKDDLLALAILSKILAMFRSRLGKALRDDRHWDVYDMSTKPEKGDALDHLGDDVRLVVTCHIPMFPIVVTSKKTIRRLKRYKHMQAAYFYNNRNCELLPWCMAHRVPLLAYGDQPVSDEYSPFIEEQIILQTQFFERPLTVLYEAAEMRRISTKRSDHA